jgi:hypothetical protein
LPKPRYITGRRREGLEHLERREGLEHFDERPSGLEHLERREGLEHFDERREGLEHLDNFESKEFEKDIMDAQETHRHILMRWAASHNIQPPM